LEDIWRMEVEPYLEEYFFDRRGVVDEYRWERIGGALNP
jgi:5-methylcytosine-specific restriction protein B